MSTTPRRPPADLVRVRCRSALQRVSGMWFRWSLNPYVGCVHRCTFCYVRAFELRADRDHGEGYGRTVRAKDNVVEVLAGELARRSWVPELVALGTATDPYQPAEGRLSLTRGCLEQLAAHRTPLSITTRGPLVVRDIDVLSALARRVPVTVALSIPSLDADVVRATEPGTAPPRQRLRAVGMLAAAGVRAGVLMAPILPGLSDRPEQLAEVATAARDAGACFLGAGMLTLKPGTREHYLAALAIDRPDLLPRYARLYAGRVTLASRDADPTLGQVEGLRRRLGVADRRPQQVRPPSPPLQLGLAV